MGDDQRVMTGPPRYTHFILLLWEERPPQGGQGGWRLSLENPHSGRRVGFQTPGDLADFLSDWITHPDTDDDSQTGNYEENE